MKEAISYLTKIKTKVAVKRLVMVASTKKAHNSYCVKKATLDEQCTKTCQALLKQAKEFLKITMLLDQR